MNTHTHRNNALDLFMAQNPQTTGCQLPKNTTAVVDDLSRSSTGYRSPPFVPKPIGDFWEPPRESMPVQPVREPVVLETLNDIILRLPRKRVSVDTFCKGFEGSSIPYFMVVIILTKLSLIDTDKNGRKTVNVVDVSNNIQTFVKTIDTVRMKVDLMDSLFETLRDGKTLHWSAFMNKTSKTYVNSGLSRPENTEVFQLLRVLGVVNSRNDRLIIPNQWKSLSQKDCHIMLWNLVSQSEITTTPHAKEKKCGRTNVSQSEVATTSQEKAKKRGRMDLDNLQQNQDNRRKLSDDELVRIFFTHLSEYILPRREFAVSLTEVIDNAFLALSPNDLRQLMDFLSSRDTIWIFQRIMMDILPLTLLFPEEECFLLVHNEFSALSLNMTEIMDKYYLFSIEAISHFEDASRRIHEERVKEEKEIERCRLLNDEFISLLYGLWQTKNMEAFFVGLRKLCSEFNSKHTNLSLLEIVVGEFRFLIYNATTRAYHNGDPCGYPLQDFLDYCIKRGVFRMRTVHQRI